MIQSISHRSLYGFACLMVLGLLASAPAQAHKTLVDGDIAGTWHIDPDHNPKAGEPATAWVALTRKGGTLLPLNEANCQMQVYTLPRQPEAIPILEPPVKAIAAEQYSGIPGSDIVFPAVGQYQLQLNCTPIQENAFAPFQLQYDVTVAAGNPTPAPSTVTGSPLPPPPGAEAPRGSSGGVSAGGAIALISVAGVGGWLWFTRRKQG
ncbi:hypothetical protein [Leptolyngbya sp. FACHB-8]|nr:hypothetical protein [Leptolyngbya sp. FACHB-8]MBD1909675.1 hypothetical protein [Leptolyngbya sp. FACHB-8]MBD2157548.1 hypothetical protein [Leptolyngbya sp. FACHB-16]